MKIIALTIIGIAQKPFLIAFKIVSAIIVIPLHNYVNPRHVIEFLA